MHAFKMNTNTNENTVMLAILATSNTSHSVPKKTNSVYIMNDDDTLVPMITSAVKLRCIGRFGILCTKDIPNIMR